MLTLLLSAGYEYDPGADGRITWAYKNQPTWQINAAAMLPNAGTQVGQRLISVEPMYMYADVPLISRFAEDHADPESVRPSFRIMNLGTLSFFRFSCLAVDHSSKTGSDQ